MTDQIGKMAANALAAARAEVGPKGWAVLSPALREGLVARQALRIISANDENDGWQRASALATTVLRMEVGT